MAYRESRLWPDGEIPYEIDAALRVADVVRTAAAQWAAATGLRLVELTDGQPAPDRVRFEPGDRCSSDVGRTGGVQLVTLTPRCRKGVVLHEIGHVIGLVHEHCRGDRDEQVAIRWENVLPSAYHNFQISDESDYLEQFRYDLTSIMHYHRVAFSHNRSETIVPLRPGQAYGQAGAAVVGQRRDLSEGDVVRVRALYGLDEAATARG